MQFSTTTGSEGDGLWLRAWALSVLVGVVLSPLAPWIAAQIWPCPWKTLTGFPCLLCGTTRAALLLARFEPVEALLRFPLPTLAWAFWAIGGGFLGLAWMLGRRPTLPAAWVERLRSRSVVAVLLVAVLANWIYSIATGV